MKIEIVFYNRKKKSNVTKEFDSVKDAFKFIIFNSPCEIEAIRVSGEGGI